MGSYILLYSLGRWLRSREEADGLGSYAVKRPVHKWISSVLLRSYAISMKLPPLRYYLLKVRSRLAILHVEDEFRLRRQTMKFVYLFTGSSIMIIAVLTAMNPSLVFFLSLLIAGVFIQGLLLDGYVNRLEKKLLAQILDLFSAVRHAYHQHGMVSDAIDEASEVVEKEISQHASHIYNALTDAKPDEALEKYYETAPNRFLRAFAGISRLVMEFGDRKKNNGSLYLRGLASLTREIQLDLIRRGKLDYLLQGLNIIALAPVFFTKPVEIWARRNFPLMDQFYLSKAGLVAKIGLFIVIFICCLLLQKLKGEEDTVYRAGRNREPWEAKLYRWNIVRQVTAWFSPKTASAGYDRLKQLLKDTNHHLNVEWLQVRRIGMFLLCVLVTVGAESYLHWKSRTWILNEPPASYVFFGTMSREDAEKATRTVALDRSIMKKIGMGSGTDKERVAAAVANTWLDDDRDVEEAQLAAISERVIDKMQRWNGEYLKWWELTVALVTGCAGYYAPVWVLMFQRRMRLIDMRNEVYQFQNLITILRELERISVEEILEWLHMYAVIFKIPLQKCLLHYGHGGEDALRQMKEEASLDEFRQLADKLLLAAEKITIADAFDELESEMSYQFERRRLDYEKSLDTKAEWGRIIGFAPMYSLVFVYLVIPLIWMSFQQMGIYFEQIQQI